MKNKTKELNEKCLTCGMCDTSDIPNLFCKLNSELINDGDYRYCPKKPRETVNFIHKQDEEIENLKQQLDHYKNLGVIQEETDLPPKGKIRINKEEGYTVVSFKDKKFLLLDCKLIELAELAGLFNNVTLHSEVTDEKN